MNTPIARFLTPAALHSCDRRTVRPILSHRIDVSFGEIPEVYAVDVSWIAPVAANRSQVVYEHLPVSQSIGPECERSADGSGTVGDADEERVGRAQLLGIFSIPDEVELP